MQKKAFLPLALLIVFIISLAAPAVAEDDVDKFDHWIVYDLDGLISITREIGHACTTGAVKMQTVNGYGEFKKIEDIKIRPNIMRIEEVSDWKTAEDAIRNLTVTTRIDLCARPMVTAASVYDEGDYDIRVGDLIHTYHPLVVSGDVLVSRMTTQNWVTRVSPDPGNTGSYHADFIAAYGPGPYEEDGVINELGIATHYEDKYRWWFDPSKDDGIDRGDYYVGNYFELEQFAATSGGELSRFFSMSSPFSAALLEEDLQILGSAEIREAFELDNLEGGRFAITLAWYDLF